MLRRTPADLNPQSIEHLLAVKANAENNAKLAIQQERAHLLIKARTSYSTEDRAFIYFVSQLTSRLVTKHGVYKLIKGDDTLWNDICRFIKRNTQRLVLKNILTEAVGIGTQAAGVNQEGQEMAEASTGVLVNTVFAIYNIYDARRRAESIRIADNFLALANTSEDFGILARDLAIHLFARLRLIICKLSSPRGVNDLIDFIMESLYQAISATNQNRIPISQVGKKNFLFEACVPEPNSSRYYRLPGRRSAIAIQTSSPPSQGHSWTLVGALCHAPVIVLNGNIIYVNEGGLRADAKYPPHFIATQEEAARLGLRDITEFVWQGLSETEIVARDLENNLTVISQLGEYLSKLLMHAAPSDGSDWMNAQFSRIATIYWRLFSGIPDRNIEKKVFFHLLNLAERLQGLAGTRFNIHNLCVILPNMLFLLRAASAQRQHIKWDNLQLRVNRLNPIPDPLALHLPAPPNNELVLRRHANNLPAPIAVQFLQNAAPLGGAPFPIFPVTGAEAGFPPALPQQPLQDNKNKVKVTVWRQGNRCSFISIQTYGTNEFHVYFSNTQNIQALPPNGVVKTISLRNQSVVIHNADTMSPNPQTYTPEKTRTFIFDRLNAVAIKAAYVALCAADPALHNDFNQYFNRRIYGQHHALHLHVSLFLLTCGGLLRNNPAIAFINSNMLFRYFTAGFIAVQNRTFDSVYFCIREAKRAEELLPPRPIQALQPA